MADQAVDPYKVLGVPRDAGKQEIRQAFRKLARRYHPDHNPGDKTAEEKFKDINAAYEILSDPGKRAVYDQRREGSRLGAGQPGGNLLEYFLNLFTTFLSQEGPGSLGNFDLPPQQTPVKEVSFPENDLGLLQALMEAYRAPGDGKWVVRRAETDKRKWLPDRLYLVRRKGNEVYVYRKVVDWRDSWDRGKQIEVSDKIRSWQVDRRFPPNQYLGEYYLCGDGRLRLRGIFIPQRYGDYLRAVKSLAFKLVHKRRDFNNELNIINQYARVAHRAYEEDYVIDPDYEVVRTIPVRDLGRRLVEAERRVVRIEGGTRPEGQRRGGAEGNRPGWGSDVELKG